MSLLGAVGLTVCFSNAVWLVLFASTERKWCGTRECWKAGQGSWWNGSVKQTQFCVRFIAGVTKNGSFQSVFALIPTCGHKPWVMTIRKLSQVIMAGIIFFAKGLRRDADKLKFAKRWISSHFSEPRDRRYIGLSRMSQGRLARGVLLAVPMEKRPRDRSRSSWSNCISNTVTSKKNLHWANVCFSAHALAQSQLSSVQYVNNLKCCKCAGMVFHCASSLVQGQSQTFSFGGATGGASFATRGAVNGLCRTFRKRPTPPLKG